MVVVLRFIGGRGHIYSLYHHQTFFSLLIFLLVLFFLSAFFLQTKPQTICFAVCFLSAFFVAFGNWFAKVHTALLNGQATSASALPTGRASLASVGDPMYPIPSFREFDDECDVRGMNEVEVDEEPLLVHTLQHVELFLQFSTCHTTCSDRR